MTAKYDTIGRTYARTRKPEPRFAARIHAALGDARTVLNVGAGTGSYEPDDRFVVGIDPSMTMLAQRYAPARPAVRGTGEQLPFPDGSFDAVMATLTMHHWADAERGAREMRRVAPRQVVLYFETPSLDNFWLVTDYFPQFVTFDTNERAPGTDFFREHFDLVAVEALPVPADCEDGFAAAFWNRPERYLDPDVQAGISFLAELDPSVREPQIAQLRRDLESGAWDERHGHLRALDEYDANYRLAIAGS